VRGRRECGAFRRCTALSGGRKAGEKLVDFRRRQTEAVLQAAPLRLQRLLAGCQPGRLTLNARAAGWSRPTTVAMEETLDAGTSAL